MSLNSTPAAERVHIGIFGRRNAGKSSVINAITGQDLAIVSEIKGTTTDPVSKTMELLPLGPVVVIDTPGIDDEGELGALRVRKSLQVLNKTDIALLVADARLGLGEEEREIVKRFEEKKIPYLIAMNKSDLVPAEKRTNANGVIWVSAKTGENIHALRERIAAKAPVDEPQTPIIADLLAPGDFVVLVVPIDKAAPKGRLILPQQQTIRDALEAGATAVVVREHELAATLAALGKKPRIVVTDSQAFAQVSADTPREVALTSFSILFARHKGILQDAVAGVRALDDLADHAHILISEGCTHHRQCDDIGTVKLPRWIAQYTGKTFDFHFTSGTEFPDDLSEYGLVVHCGGCMLSEREVKYRMQCARDQNVPMTNYGILIAYMQGILQRSVAPLPEIAVLLE